jgi:UDP-N-acetylglucosamine enolpyruvyl transferase
MSEIELAPLSETLDDEELRALQKLLEQAGARMSGQEDQVRHKIATRLDEDAMTEFLDRLEAHDMAADIYVPVEFEGRLHVGEYRVASAQLLVDVLDEMKDELDVEEDKEEYEDEEAEEEGEETEEEDTTVIEAQLRHIWKLVSDACNESVEKNVPLHLRL